MSNTTYERIKNEFFTPDVTEQELARSSACSPCWQRPSETLYVFRCEKCNETITLPESSFQYGVGVGVICPTCVNPIACANPKLSANAKGWDSEPEGGSDIDEK